MSPTPVERARAFYDERAWTDCCAAFEEADAADGLAARDLLLLATAAALAGRDADSDGALARAHRAFVDGGRWSEAARTAFWLAFQLLNRGETSQGSGWVARCARIVEDHLRGSAEEGLLAGLDAHKLVDSGDLAGGLERARQAFELGRSRGDVDLQTLSLLVTGQALLGLGRLDEGVAALDEAMVAVCADEVRPQVAGVTYCGVILACSEIHDVERARQWTAALTRWCDAQSGLVPFQGECVVHRAEVLTFLGDWADAVAELVPSCDGGNPRIAAVACYRLGELHRRRGELGPAEEAYRRANAQGREPEPGLTLLWLAQGRLDAAAARAQRLVGDPPPGTDRVEVLDAAVHVLLEAGDLPAAAAAAAQLEALAGPVQTLPLVRAVAARAAGAVRLAQGAEEDALRLLRDSWRVWQVLDAPYEAARVRVLMSRCLSALGDEVSALMQRDAARMMFEQLGAAPDLQLLAPPGGHRGSLTDRELQVLRHVAAGLTNRQVARDLVLSEKTVARHLSNIYGKLGVSSRTAAISYLYEQGLR